MMNKTRASVNEALNELKDRRTYLAVSKAFAAVLDQLEAQSKAQPATKPKEVK